MLYKEVRVSKKMYTQEELAEIVGGILTKNNDTKLDKVAPPLLADENALALALGEEEIANLEHSKAKCALTPLGVSFENISTIEVERPRLAMMKLLHVFYEAPDTPVGIHPTAVIHPEAKLGKNVSIGPNVVVSRGAIIGDNTKIMANVYVGKFAKIGENCLFHPSVNIGDYVQVGARVIIHHGASLGADGFSFVTETPDNIEQARQEGSISGGKEDQRVYKIPSLGSVLIEDDVEIGANTTIDRGTVENTVVGAQTKIDNLVMIGHNCKIGKCCMIVSQVGIAGSCTIGDRVVIAGQAGLADHIEIGSDSIILAKAGVTKTHPARSVLMGAPAVPRKDFLKRLKYLGEAEVMVQKYKKYQHLLEDYEKFLNEDAKI
ncbi:MAG: UDP-3-O-(3-hydroxymyristoyl)glucosamine N-acyltransferase [Cyanobacteria bacterium SIG30]|nr:UDP-3-O-(3-hydroxymyristoyl)glucosamine N-acyltransferase [Cyanobacteria bacterium SIG30]